MKGICALTGSPYNVLTIQKILNAYWFYFKGVFNWNI